MKLVAAYNQLNSLSKFVVNSAIVIIVWFSFFSLLRFSPFIHPAYEWITHNLTLLLLKGSQFTLSIIGEESLIYKKSIQQIGGNGIYLDRGCLGRNLMGLFAGFILVMPGRIDTKTWFIPLGLAMIFIINILRLVGLYLTNKYYPQYMDINHHAIFKYTVYGLTFLLWYVWIKKLRLRSKVIEK